MIKVGFQGVKGAYSEQASFNFFGNNIELKNYDDFYLLFKSLQDNEVDYITVPIENSLAGSIHENFDHIINFNFHIEGQHILRVSHNLIAIPNSDLNTIKAVYSHPQALAQCSNFFKKYPHIKKIPFYDTAGAAKLVQEKQDASIAAIASQKAAVDYNLKIIKKELENDKTNFTRFWIISKKPLSEQKKQKNKTYKSSVVFSLKSIPGALFKSLSVFYLRDIDLLKIESRPLVGSPWEYMFYVDFKGHFLDKNIKNALNNLKEIANSITILGSYEYIKKDKLEI